MRDLVDRFRPLNDWALIKVEEVPKVSDIIVAPENMPRPIRKATVVKVGPGRHYRDGVYIPCGVKPGDRIVFFAAVLDTKQGKTVIHSLPDGYSLVREVDILIVIDEGDPKIEV